MDNMTMGKTMIFTVAEPDGSGKPTIWAQMASLRHKNSQEACEDLVRGFFDLKKMPGANDEEYLSSVAYMLRREGYCWVDAERYCLELSEVQG